MRLLQRRQLRRDAEWRFLRHIPKSIRAEVGPICERFIQDHIASRTDFATETTLRSPIVFDQIKQASEAGFMVRFTYVCVDNVGTSVKRVTQRAYQGGHSGSENTILDIRLKSLGHLLRALNEMGKTIDLLDTFDNSALNSQPRLIASFQARQITHLDPHLPTWLTDALQNTPYSTPDLLSHFHQKQPLPAPPSPR